MSAGTRRSVPLGHGFVGQFVWQEAASPETGVPCGVILRHGACSLYVAWADDGWLYADGVRPTWDLVSLVPLSIAPGVSCPSCGRVGVVEGGRWIDVTEADS